MIKTIKLKKSQIIDHGQVEQQNEEVVNGGLLRRQEFDASTSNDNALGLLILILVEMVEVIGIGVAGEGRN
ncbi:hypothetical protein ACFX13_018071 [Malus domestica]